MPVAPPLSSPSVKNAAYVPVCGVQRSDTPPGGQAELETPVYPRSAPVTVQSVKSPVSNPPLRTISALAVKPNRPTKPSKSAALFIMVRSSPAGVSTSSQSSIFGVKDLIRLPQVAFAVGIPFG